MEQLPRRQQAPAWICVHRLAGHHHRVLLCQVTATCLDSLTASLQFPSIAPTCAAFQNMQLMCFRIAQRPQLRVGGEDEIQAVHGQVLCDPRQRRNQSRTDVPTIAAHLRGDQRKHSFTVRLAVNQARSLAFSNAGVQLSQSVHHAVVGKKPAVLLKWVGVLHGVTARGRIPDVGQEFGALQGPG